MSNITFVKEGEGGVDITVHYDGLIALCYDDPYCPVGETDETGGATIKELLGQDTPHMTDRIDAIDERIKGTKGT